MTNTVVRDNGGAGVVCSNCGNLEVTGSSISLNTGGGIVVNVDQDDAGDNIHVNVDSTSVFDNSKDGRGGWAGRVHHGAGRRRAGGADQHHRSTFPATPPPA